MAAAVVAIWRGCGGWESSGRGRERGSEVEEREREGEERERHDQRTTS